MSIFVKQTFLISANRKKSEILTYTKKKKEEKFEHMSLHEVKEKKNNKIDTIILFYFMCQARGYAAS